MSEDQVEFRGWWTHPPLVRAKTLHFLAIGSTHGATSLLAERERLALGCRLRYPWRLERPTETLLAVFHPRHRRLSAISPVTRGAVEANDPVRWMQGFSLDSSRKFMDRNNDCTHCIIPACPQRMSDPARLLRRTASPTVCRTQWSHPKLILIGEGLSLFLQVSKRAEKEVSKSLG